jgi:hypothetical protein
MTLEPKRSASLISVGDLTKVVESAVSLAQKRIGMNDAGKSLIVKWDLIGRRLPNFQQAQSFAAAVTTALAEEGFKADPAILINKKIIVAGFFERINAPQTRSF